MYTNYGGDAEKAAKEKEDADPTGKTLPTGPTKPSGQPTKKPVPSKDPVTRPEREKEPTRRLRSSQTATMVEATTNQSRSSYVAIVAGNERTKDNS